MFSVVSVANEKVCLPLLSNIVSIIKLKSLDIKDCD